MQYAQRDQMIDTLQVNLASLQNHLTQTLQIYDHCVTGLRKPGGPSAKKDWHSEVEGSEDKGWVQG